MGGQPTKPLTREEVLRVFPANGTVPLPPIKDKAPKRTKVSPALASLDPKLWQPYKERVLAAGTLVLNLHRLTGLPKTDQFGTCDPYVRITLFDRRGGDHRFVWTSAKKFNTMEPVYNQTVLIPFDKRSLDSQVLRFEVWDTDRMKDDLVSSIRLGVGELVHMRDLHSCSKLALVGDTVECTFQLQGDNDRNGVAEFSVAPPETGGGLAPVPNPVNARVPQPPANGPPNQRPRPRMTSSQSSSGPVMNPNQGQRRQTIRHI
eukprot:TRINITY_DN10593_c0_g1_i1.p1 TRINITY_DN10593_c0_g1~~TRINITY_DN10593_c0_g1_i1.p1  ORF type:complete len:261 (-),score=29.16 TRINITY_DN10593_c0_g1_i1:400-1182(-)